MFPRRKEAAINRTTSGKIEVRLCGIGTGTLEITWTWTLTGHKASSKEGKPIYLSLLVDTIGLVAVHPCSPGSSLCHWWSLVSHFSILFPILVLKWAIPRRQCKVDPGMLRMDRQQVVELISEMLSFGLWLKGAGNKNSEAELLWIVFDGCKRLLLWKGRKKWLMLMYWLKSWLFRVTKWEAECFRHVLKEMDVGHQMLR